MNCCLIIRSGTIFSPKSGVFKKGDLWQPSEILPSGKEPIRNLNPLFQATGLSNPAGKSGNFLKKPQIVIKFLENLPIKRLRGLPKIRPDKSKQFGKNLQTFVFFKEINWKRGGLFLLRFLSEGNIDTLISISPF